MIQISGSSRLKSLDGIRGLAILAVFLNHIELKVFPSFPLLLPKKIKGLTMRNYECFTKSFCSKTFYVEIKKFNIFRI